MQNRIVGAADKVRLLFRLSTPQKQTFQHQNRGCPYEEQPLFWC